jgi:hypothetical protein
VSFETVLNVTEILVVLGFPSSYNLGLISCFHSYLDSPVIIYNELGSMYLSTTTFSQLIVLENETVVPDPKEKHATTGPNVSFVYMS